MKFDNENTQPNTPVATAETIYPLRLQQARNLQTKLHEREKRFSYSKLALVAVIVGVAVWSMKHLAVVALLAFAIAIFILLSILHERALQALRRCERIINFYERGIERLNGWWPGKGETGDAFLDPLHPYARDLDIFGTASIFELLCTARTRAGEGTLARWLLSAAQLDDIRARQAAVSELASRIDFREKLSTLAEGVRLGVKPEALAAWGENSATFRMVPPRWVMIVLAALWIASLACWAAWGLFSVALLMSAVNIGVSYKLQNHVQQPIDAVESAGQDMKLLAAVLDFMEREKFSAPKLVQLQTALRRDGVAPSVAIERLSRIVERLESRRNLFVKAVDIFIFWSAQLAFSTETWRLEFGPAIRGWLDAVGELEALTALSGYAYEHPSDTYPEFVESGPYFDAEGFAHPLLPEGTAVRNDLKMGRDLQLMIISGPNMAGKSTFMRAIGVNAVLAQCGAPVRAYRLTLSQLAVAASICVLDSLQGGVSRFYAEINRLKLISDLTHGSAPVLFMLDELLSGTNSHDRLIGTQFIVQSLVDQGAIGIVTTHDLALTTIPETMGASAVNCHFEDHLENGELKFNYILSPGIVQTSNALELMRSIGLKVG